MMGFQWDSTALISILTTPFCAALQAGVIQDENNIFTAKPQLGFPEHPSGWASPWHHPTQMGWQSSDPDCTCSTWFPTSAVILSCNYIYSPMTGVHLGRFSNPRQSHSTHTKSTTSISLQTGRNGAQDLTRLDSANSLTPKEHCAYTHRVAVHLYIHLSICCEELKSLRCRLWHGRLLSDTSGYNTRQGTVLLGVNYTVGRLCSLQGIAEETSVY